MLGSARLVDDIACPGDPGGTGGHRDALHSDGGGEKLGITVKMTSVEGTQIDYDSKVDSLDQ